MNPLTESQDKSWSANQTIYDQILSDIAHGIWVSGDRLVTTSLAKRYDTSVNPIREALKQLEGEGFVTFQKNSGARVAQFEYSTMRDVFEILQLLEPYFLNWFTDSYTAKNIACLEAIMEQMKAISHENPAEFRELDTKFHWEMYKGHYNESAVQLWKSKKIVLQAMHCNIPIHHRRYEQALNEHQQLLDLLKSNESERAKELLVQHILNGGDYWSKNLAR
ncbi:GntR family transcriptional regulator [Echinimonas agarilytica]|uniref:GntR family transcriptional regulator n=1 Tax=Echinimonas agarilytica TaxID=1215918 RepID=A0AA42B7X3_9GAMM|nr:GntR family transcriptional regulator [Echinimonas agarilytica]MCM2680199.1 GntR family transcriptional regulator [Echinimonas agarilytica]